MTFLVRNHPDFHSVKEYAAVSDTKIETLCLCDTYDRYGGLISHADAGDWLTIVTDKGASIASAVWKEEYDEEKEFAVGDTLSAYDHPAIFDELEFAVGVEVDYTTVQGFNYWDGHNWHTIVTADDYRDYELEWEVVTDEKLIAELEAAIRDCEFHCEGLGYKQWRTDKWIIEQNYYQDSWSQYDITLVEDEEVYV